MEDGANVNAFDFNDRSPLYYATQSGSETAVRVLLGLGATIFDESGVGETYSNNIILNEAAEDGKLAILQLLLERIREDRRLPNSDKLAVISDTFRYARTRGRTEATELLRQALKLYIKGKIYEKMSNFLNPPVQNPIQRGL